MTTYSEPFLLSEKGSTRATAYGFSNKSITLDRKTHVVWLDAIAQVCGRTYEHATGKWSETYKLFEGCDNHTSPALTADKDRHLHLVYGPHGLGKGWNHGRFKWTKSEQPDSIQAWGPEQNFGYNSTYASMVHAPGNLDVIVYRGGESPASFMFQKQRPLGGWSTAQCLLGQNIEPQYTQYGGIIACDQKGTLYTAGHFYNTGGGDNAPVKGDRSRMRSYGAAVLKSTDLGETWTDLSGKPFETPGFYEERIAIPPLNGYVYIKGLHIDSHGTLWALTLKPTVDDERILLSHWTDHGWETVDLQSSLPEDRVAIDAVLTLDIHDQIHLAITAVRKGQPNSERAWGQISNEIFHLVTKGTAEKAECNMISIPDDTTPNWLPNISLPGPFHPVKNPVILYTHGIPGEGCSPSTETDVYCVMVNNEK